MTEKDLIFKLQQLKKIKPTPVWVSLTKAEVFKSDAIAQTSINRVNYMNVLANFFATIFQKKPAYAFAVLLVMMTGFFGVMQLDLFNSENGAITKNTLSLQLQAGLEDAPVVKTNIENLKKSSQDLAVLTKKENKDSLGLAIEKVRDAAKNLANSVKENPASAKAVALEVQKDSTILSIVGGSDFKESSDILYKAIDEQMIADLKKATLTQDQTEKLMEAEKLYEEEKYAQVLEKLLLINN